jgi:hypothetical protein
MKKRGPEVPQKLREELGRTVELFEVAGYGDASCRTCWGSGFYLTNHTHELHRRAVGDVEVRVEGKPVKVPHVCECAWPRFLKAHLSSIGYVVDEKGTPIRWIKGYDPRETNNPEPGAEARP